MKLKLVPLSIVFAFLGNLLWLVGISLQEGTGAFERILGRLGMEWLLLSGSLWALRNGRYPTFAEAGQITLPERLLSMALIWLVAALVSFLVVIVFIKLPRRAKVIVIAISLISVSAWMSYPYLPQPASAEITVDVSVVLGPFPTLHRNVSQGGEAEMQTQGYFAQTVQPLSALKPGYVRIDHIYDYYDVYTVVDDKPQYNWTALDEIIDTIREAGAEPFISLSYLPPAMAADVYGPPSDLAAWEELVYQTVHHFNIDRGLGIRYWEVWNEPNMPSFWHGTIEDYLALYEATAQGALRADPTVKLGGPATASLNRWLELGSPMYEQNWVESLVRYTNAHDLPLDFVSWHYYDPLPENYAWSIQQHQQWVSGSENEPQLFLTEWNRSMLPDAQLDTTVTAAHAAAVVSTLVDQPLEQAFFFELIDNSLGNEGRWGMLHADGTPKPVYTSYYLLSKLEGSRLQASSNQLDVGVLASQSNGQTRILVWRYAESLDTLTATIHLTGLPAETVSKVTTYDLASGTDSSTGSPLQITAAEQGEEQFSVELLPHDVRLFVISPE